MILDVLSPCQSNMIWLYLQVGLNWCHQALIFLKVTVYTHRAHSVKKKKSLLLTSFSICTLPSLKDVDQEKFIKKKKNCFQQRMLVAD